jgi:hypothetical protein
MPRKKTQLPKTQEEILRDQLVPYDPQGVPVSENPKTKRALNSRVDKANEKTLTIGLKDIDQAIVYYFENVIKPSAIQNGNKISVPILYGSPERWSAVQKDGFYRDKNGKIMTPLIMFKRDSVEKNRTLGNKLDGNFPKNIQYFEKRYNSREVYDNFSVINNRKPTKQYVGVVIPDYVNVTYSCVIFTDYVEQMNKIVESINYASDSYWGDPEKFKFRAMIDTYTTSVELAKGQDRAVKTTFSINLLGHIIPDNINTLPLGSRKVFSKSRILFNFETQSDKETLQASSLTPVREASRRFFENTLTGAQSRGMTVEQIIFTTTSNTAIADTIQSNFATFLNKTILTPPPGFSLDEDSFTVYVNGVAINPDHVLRQQDGTNITASFNPTLIGYSIEQTDTVVITGKFT